MIIVFLLVGFGSLLIIHLNKQHEKPANENNNLFSDKSIEIKDNLSCSSECVQRMANVTVTQGRVVCDNDILSVICWPGFKNYLQPQLSCFNLELQVSMFSCKALQCEDTDDRKCSESLLILVGGEKEGELVSTVETFPPSNLSSCLPDLPRAVKWGALGLLEGTSLVVCGGQNRADQPTQECWVLDLDSASADWRLHQKLKR